MVELPAVLLAVGATTADQVWRRPRHLGRGAARSVSALAEDAEDELEVMDHIARATANTLHAGEPTLR